MKKILMILSVAILVFSFVGCQDENGTDGTTAKLMEQVNKLSSNKQVTDILGKIGINLGNDGIKYEGNSYKSITDVTNNIGSLGADGVNKLTSIIKVITSGGGASKVIEVAQKILNSK